MTLRASVRIDTKSTIKRLQQLQNKLDNAEMERFLEESVRPYLRDRAVLRFSQEGDDAVGQWKELLKTTRGIRKTQAKKYGWPIQPAHPINVRSGELKRFILDTHSIQTYSNGPRLFVPRLGGNQELQKKFKTAQQGKPGKVWKVATVPRPVVAVGQRDKADIETLWGRWIAKVLATL